MAVVTRAMITHIVKRLGETTPISRPMLRTTISIRPRVFISTPIVVASRQENPTARALTIMAAVERGLGSDDAVVRGWLAKAVTASRGPQWICDHCHTVHAEWAPVCASCGNFDSLSWREAPQTAAPLANRADMLPLIIGRGAHDRTTAEP